MVRRSLRHDVSAMSPSTRSKPASASSPETGRDKQSPFRPEDPKRAPLETVVIELEVSRQRWITWAIGGIVGGLLLIWKLGTVGVWAGYVLVAIGLYRAVQLALSFKYPAGKFVIAEDKVSLPRGVHRPTGLD